MDTNELERQLLLKVLLRAKEVVDCDWGSIATNGPDMQALRSVVDDALNFQKLTRDAENAQRASMYQNMAGGGS